MDHHVVASDLADCYQFRLFVVQWDELGWHLGACHGSGTEEYWDQAYEFCVSISGI